MIGIGFKSGNLTIVAKSNISRRWVCDCSCGNKIVVAATDLKKGQKYCKNCAPKGRPSHGLSHLPEFAIWSSMKQRCNNKNSNAYHNYGGRGISYSQRWEHFEVFLEDMGRRPTKNHTLERKNNNGNYEKDNCKWATRKEQARNYRHNNILEFNGEKRCISEWAEIYGLKHDTIATRLRIGWSIEKAITTKILNNRRLILVNGVEMPIRTAERLLGFGSGTITNRIKSGYSVEEAVSIPPSFTNRRNK